MNKSAEYLTSSIIISDVHGVQCLLFPLGTSVGRSRHWFSYEIYIYKGHSYEMKLLLDISVVENT